jgi:hypothetical protein
MAPVTILIGALLVAVGCIGYFMPNVFGEGTAQASMTGLIPAYIGGALMICGLIVLAKPTLRKHVMHLAAMVGVIGTLGGTMPIFRGGLDFGKASVIAGILTSLLSTVFVFLCVRSFIQARKAREATSANA